MDDETRAAFEALTTRMNNQHKAVMASLTTLLIATRWYGRYDQQAAPAAQDRPSGEAP